MGSHRYRSSRGKCPVIGLELEFVRNASAARAVRSCTHLPDSKRPCCLVRVSPCVGACHQKTYMETGFGRQRATHDTQRATFVSQSSTKSAAVLRWRITPLSASVTNCATSLPHPHSQQERITSSCPLPENKVGTR